MKTRFNTTLLAALLGVAFTGEVRAQTSAFTYQGQLTDNGSPASGIYDLRFTIYDLDTGGSVIAGPITNSPTAVTDGLFTTTLNFGAGVFDGSERWLEIAVATNGSGVFTNLSPRQSITSTPYAIKAANAANAASAYTAASVTANGVANSSLQADAVTSDKIEDGTIIGSDLSTVLASNTFWRLDGNTGTSPGTQFLGTTDNQPLGFRVNQQLALQLIPTPDGLPHVVAGTSNVVGSGVRGATIAGGYLHDIAPNINAPTIGGGFYNRISSGANAAVISGGAYNTNGVNSYTSTIGGGGYNGVGDQAHYSTIAGGYHNRIQLASESATIAGGYLNTIGDNMNAPTIGGGFDNQISSGANAAVISGGAYNTNGVNSYGSTIGGGGYNSIGDQAPDSTIAGGYHNRIQFGPESATIGGGYNNNISSNASYATIAGGEINDIGVNSGWSFIGGGYGNNVSSGSLNGTIAGGSENHIDVDSDLSSIGGGQGNHISSNALHAVIPGGYLNAVGADASYAFAAGQRAKANHPGTFVWSDSEGADFASTGTNQFLIRASGGVGLGTNNPATALHVVGTVTADGFSGPIAADQLTGTIAPTNFAPGTITSNMLAAGAVGTEQLAQGTVFNGSFVGDGSGLSGLNSLDAADGSPTNAVYVDPEGFVGIGTLTPREKLEVEGGNIRIQGVDGFDAAGESAYLYLGSSPDYLKATRDFGINLGVHGAPDAVTIQNQTGNVGIGTTNPATALQVAGAATADSYALSSAQLRTMSFSGTAFTPTSSSATYVAPAGVNHGIYGSTAGQSVQFVTPVHFPDGATFKGFRILALDDDATQDISVSLYRHSGTTASGNLGQADSSGSTNVVQTITATAAPTSVDNASQAFILIAQWTVPATPANIRLVRVYVDYEIATVLP